MHRHILICGPIGVGKSTLILRLLVDSGRPVSGYVTKSLKKRPDGYHEIYMFAPGDVDNAVYLAECDSVHRSVNTGVFETLGVELLSRVKPGDIILMDEIGFMEEAAPRFTERVLELLDGDITVIGAVKNSHPDSAYLNAVRNHPNVDLYSITEENRDELLMLLKNDPRLK